MIRRRAVIGLSLICVFAFCAFAAQGASALGTTAFTCEKTVSNTGDFTEADCQTTGVKGKSEYAHQVISTPNTKVVASQTKNSVLKGEVALTKSEITCTTATGTGEITNEEVAGKMQVSGASVVTKFTGCTVNKPLKCIVKEPIEVQATSITRTDLGAGKNEMGAEAKPVGGANFTEIEFKDKGVEVCALKNKKFPISGTALSTSTEGGGEAAMKGAVNEFTNAMTKETLKFGGNPAEFSSAGTLKMEGGNAISGTTTAN